MIRECVGVDSAAEEKLCRGIAVKCCKTCRDRNSTDHRIDARGVLVSVDGCAVFRLTVPNAKPETVPIAGRLWWIYDIAGGIEECGE